MLYGSSLPVIVRLGCVKFGDVNSQRGRESINEHVNDGLIISAISSLLRAPSAESDLGLVVAAPNGAWGSGHSDRGWYGMNIHKVFQHLGCRVGHLVRSSHKGS